MNIEEKENYIEDASNDKNSSEKMTEDEVKRQLNARAAECIMFIDD